MPLLDDCPSLHMLRYGSLGDNTRFLPVLKLKARTQTSTTICSTCSNVLMKPAQRQPTAARTSHLQRSTATCCCANKGTSTHSPTHQYFQARPQSAPLRHLLPAVGWCRQHARDIVLMDHNGDVAEVQRAVCLWNLSAPIPNLHIPLLALKQDRDANSEVCLVVGHSTRQDLSLFQAVSNACPCRPPWPSSTTEQPMRGPDDATGPAHCVGRSALLVPHNRDWCLDCVTSDKGRSQPTSKTVNC